MRSKSYVIKFLIKKKLRVKVQTLLIRINFKLIYIQWEQFIFHLEESDAMQLLCNALLTRYEL